MPIYMNRELLEKEYSIQGIPRQQEGRKSNETKKSRHDKESLESLKSKISKIMQSIQISPKTEWRL
jgi:hypothetical protein